MNEKKSIDGKQKRDICNNKQYVLSKYSVSTRNEIETHGKLNALFSVRVDQNVPRFMCQIDREKENTNMKTKTSTEKFDSWN